MPHGRSRVCVFEAHTCHSNWLPRESCQAYYVPRHNNSDRHLYRHVFNLIDASGSAARRLRPRDRESRRVTALSDGQRTRLRASPHRHGCAFLYPSPREGFRVNPGPVRPFDEQGRMSLGHFALEQTSYILTSLVISFTGPCFPSQYSTARSWTLQPHYGIAATQVALHRRRSRYCCSITRARRYSRRPKTFCRLRPAQSMHPDPSWTRILRRVSP